MSAIIKSPHTKLLAPQVDFILVDGSSSMQPKWWDFMAAADQFVHDLRTAQLNSHVITAVFDTYDPFMIQRDCKIEDFRPFCDDPLLSHWTMTNLYDGINAMGRHMRDLDPSRASLLVVTDGDTNADQYTDRTQAAAILNWARAKGWAVTFLGCDFNNSEQSEALGISDRNSIGVAQARLSDATKAFAEKRRRHYHTGEDINFSDDEKEKFGGYLAGPSR